MTIQLFFAGARAGFTRKDSQGFAAASPSPAAAAAAAAAAAIENHRVDGAARGARSADCSLADEWNADGIWSSSGNVRAASAPCTSVATSATSPAYRY